MSDLMLSFVDEQDNNLFTAMCKAIPCKGDVVSYELNSRLTDAERAEWDDEALAHAESLRGRKFEVVRIEHWFRKSLVMQPEHHLIDIIVKPVEVWDAVPQEGS